ncbi:MULTISPECIES: GNAT family N-acetyltransferase [unclassified Streptomyces]|uniref:GNAT family N-acetyltransferase n=1 Tax=unclassified Streptomyces TaxID=2593676 RepID=UPI00081B8B5D|nr:MULTISPECIES: GNAT family N-acetyltransferase [unclassified Streptomyces]MYQ86216.1 GNAT family N-acetyltransferase [Streptomyces sp. SID4936]SCE18624.1 Acetyltransferase (GNAT) family protein [Streptomyces sp. DvalAA-43]
MDDALARILTAAAQGRFPSPDGATTVVGQPGARDAGVLAFTAHSVVFTDEDPDWVRSVLARAPGDELAATMNPYFLSALMARSGRHMNTIDLLTVAHALPGEPEIALREIEDPEHPRVARAMEYRDEVRVWAAEGGVVILGRGVAGRWETAIEVAEEARGRGLGVRLARAARQLVPDAVVWAQQSPGNARSVRTFQAAGYRPVGSEALLIAG